MAGPCFIVPPHLLRGIAVATCNPDHVRKSAQMSLASHNRVCRERRERLASLSQPQDSRGRALRASPFIPERVLTRLSTSEAVDEAAREQAKKDLGHLQAFMAEAPAEQKTDEHHKGKDAPYRAVYDANKSQNEDELPGRLVRAEGQAASKDKNVNEAFDNVGHVLDFYKEIFKWKSIDNKNADVISSVHFGEGYENAFWDPKKLQMVFGDGGEFLGHFTSCIDVIGHELTHAVTEHTSPLNYYDQPGALNEHVSDVFGIMLKQKIENETSAKADWLIGEGCLLPDVKGIALRSMKSPGTAYDDDRLVSAPRIHIVEGLLTSFKGKDPQVDNMSGYKKTYEDNGGVHVYSGIPNKAFYLASVAFGGYSWEKAGQIWWKTMTSGRVPPKCTFKQFADVTVDLAKELYGDDAAKKVRKAWTDVGIGRKV